MTKLLHVQWGWVSHSLFLKSILKYFSPYEFQCRCGVQDRAAWIAGDTSCEMIPAVGDVVTLFPLTFDAGWHGLTYDWIPLDRSRGLETLGFLSLTCFSPIWAGYYSSSPGIPACSSASLLEHLISVWLSFRVFTAPSIGAGKVTFSNTNCLTGSSLHSAFMDLSSHSDPVLHRQTQAAAPTSYTTAGKTWLKPNRGKQKCIIF